MVFICIPREREREREWEKKEEDRNRHRIRDRPQISEHKREIAQGQENIKGRKGRKEGIENRASSSWMALKPTYSSGLVYEQHFTLIN